MKKKNRFSLFVVLIAALLIIVFYPKIKLLVRAGEPLKVLNEQTISEPTPDSITKRDTLLLNYPVVKKVKGFADFYWVYDKAGKKGIVSLLEYRGIVLPLDYYLYVDLKKDYTPEGDCIGTSEKNCFYIQYYTKSSWGMSFTEIGGEMNPPTPRICRNEIKSKKIADLCGSKTVIAVVYKNGFAVLKSESGYGLINNGAKLIVPLKCQHYQMVNDSLCYFYLNSAVLKIKLKTASPENIVWELRKEGSYKH